MSDNGQQVPAVVPPLGGRRPMGGGVAPELGVNAAPPQYAPVPPVGPMGIAAVMGGVPPQWQAPPSWQPQPQQPPPPQGIDAKVPAELQLQILAGIKAHAPAAEILHYFPILTLEDLHELAQRNGVPLNIGAGPLQAPQAPVQVQTVAQPQAVQVRETYAQPPIAQAMAPQAELSASVGLADHMFIPDGHVAGFVAQAEQAIQQSALPPIEAVVSVAKSLRVSKSKHWPMIEKAMKLGPYTAEQIAAAIQIPVENTKNAMAQIALKLEAERHGTGADLDPTVVPVAGVSDGRVVSESNDIPNGARVIEILRGVAEFAAAGGYSYYEIGAAAELLHHANK